MTLRALAEANVKFFTRSTWSTGQFVHTEAILFDRVTLKVKGFRACFCCAPITGDHPDCADDLWMEYTGPERENVVLSPNLPGEVFGLDLPQPVLAALAQVLSQQANASPSVLAAVANALATEDDGVPAYMVGPEMRA